MPPRSTSEAPGRGQPGATSPAVQDSPAASVRPRCGTGRAPAPRRSGRPRGRRRAEPLLIPATSRSSASRRRPGPDQHLDLEAVAQIVVTVPSASPPAPRRRRRSPTRSSRRPASRPVEAARPGRAPPGTRAAATPCPTSARAPAAARAGPRSPASPGRPRTPGAVPTGAITSSRAARAPACGSRHEDAGSSAAVAGEAGGPTPRGSASSALLELHARLRRPRRHGAVVVRRAEAAGGDDQVDAPSSSRGRSRSPPGRRRRSSTRSQRDPVGSSARPRKPEFGPGRARAGSRCR